MSAEAVVDLALAHRVVRRVRGNRAGGHSSVTTHPASHRPTPKALSPVDELCVRMASLCESAVDPLEIVAGLEAQGLGDQAVRSGYGFPDVFALAEEMYRRVPRRPAEPEPQPELWQAKPRQHMLHGLLYVLPGVCFPAAASLLAGTAARAALVVAVVISWALSQGLSYLGYTRLGRSDPGGAARLLSRGLGIGLLALLGILYVTSLVVSVPLSGLAFAAGQGTYLLAATVLMVTGVERWLLVALAPGVLASAGFLLLGQPSWLEHPVWGALAGSVLLALVLALAHTARAVPPMARLWAVREMRAVVPHALFGLLAAALLVFPVIAADIATEFTASPARPAVLLAMLGLSVSMGAAEWILYWYRRRVSWLLRTTRDLRRFALGARLVLLGAVLRYLVAAALLIAATVSIATATGFRHLEWTVGMDAAAYLVLGGALFVALLLQALGGGAITLLACAAALGVEVMLVTLGHMDVMSAQAMTCTGLMGALFLYAGIVLSKSTSHQ